MGSGACVRSGARGGGGGRVTAVVTGGGGVVVLAGGGGGGGGVVVVVTEGDGADGVGASGFTHRFAMHFSVPHSEVA